MTRTPLYRDTLALCGVLLEEIEGRERFAPLRWQLAEGALRLLDHVTLALAGFGRADHLVAADAELRALRARLHLAVEIGLLEQDSFLDLAEHAAKIGRQLGGWLRKLRRGDRRQGAVATTREVTMG